MFARYPSLQCRPTFRAESLELRLLLATVTGFKFHDQNANGVRDRPFPSIALEPGLAGWTIYRDTNNNSVLDAGEASGVTDASGAYSLSFAVLATTQFPAIVTIREVPQAGWRPTNPDTGATTVVFTSNNQTRTADFMNTQRPQVSGTVWNDANANGRVDHGDVVASGWTVFADDDDDGTLDSLEVSTVSDANGDYVLNPPGSTRIRQVPRGSWRTTFPAAASYNLTLASA